MNPAVAALDLWLFSHDGTSQFFRITADAIMEIRYEGAIIAATGQKSPGPNQH